MSEHWGWEDEQGVGSVHNPCGSTRAGALDELQGEPGGEEGEDDLAQEAKLEEVTPGDARSLLHLRGKTGKQREAEGSRGWVVEVEVEVQQEKQEG